MRIEQTIYVERESQRKIVLGKGGQTIKAIGAAARREIAELIETPVHLFLFVKVREGWGDDPERYREMGLEFPRRRLSCHQRMPTPWNGLTKASSCSACGATARASVILELMTREHGRHLGLVRGGRSRAAAAGAAARQLGARASGGRGSTSISGHYRGRGLELRAARF